MSLRLLRSSEEGKEEEVSWSEFPVEHWERTRTTMSREHLHLLPHSGDIDDARPAVPEEKLISLED